MGLVSGIRISKEKQLIKALMKNYEGQGTSGRPLRDHADSILVNFSLSLIQIMDVDEQNQVLKTNVWYHYIQAFGTLLGMFVFQQATER
ncbi:hypothetical protein ACOMHN_062694 [Nucella lapillus]